MTKIAASILSADFANLKHDCTRLLEAGVDVFCEKPMGMTLKEAGTLYPISATARRC